jgi:hypothetical protein
MGALHESSCGANPWASSSRPSSHCTCPLQQERCALCTVAQHSSTDKAPSRLPYEYEELSSLDLGGEGGACSNKLTRISVTSERPKHFGRNGTITSLGLRRITVEFDYNLPGKYVNYSHATRIAADLTSGEETTHKTTGEVDEISRLLEHLAFSTAAATISSTGKDSERSVKLAAHFDRCLRAQLEVFGQVANVHTSTDGE